LVVARFVVLFTCVFRQSILDVKKFQRRSEVPLRAAGNSFYFVICKF